MDYYFTQRNRPFCAYVKIYGIAAVDGVYFVGGGDGDDGGGGGGCFLPFRCDGPSKDRSPRWSTAVNLEYYYSTKNIDARNGFDPPYEDFVPRENDTNCREHLLMAWISTIRREGTKEERPESFSRKNTRRVS